MCPAGRGVGMRSSCPCLSELYWLAEESGAADCRCKAARRLGCREMSKLELHSFIAYRLLVRLRLPRACCRNVISVDCQPELCVLVKGSPVQLPEAEGDELAYAAKIARAQAKGG